MAQHGTTWIEQVVANNNNIIVINNTLFKTDTTKIPLPPPLLLVIGADALSLLPAFLVGCCVMRGLMHCTFSSRALLWSLFVVAVVV
jgi:hypothetical protein